MNGDLFLVTEQIVDLLQPLCPRAWLDWVTDERAVNKSDRVQVVLVATNIQHYTLAGQAGQLFTYRLSIIQPGEDYSETEPDLAGNVSTLLARIDGIDRLANDIARGLSWSNATKNVWPTNNYLCWQIDLQAFASIIPTEG